MLADPENAPKNVGLRGRGSHRNLTASCRSCLPSAGIEGVANKKRIDGCECLEVARTIAADHGADGEARFGIIDSTGYIAKDRLLTGRSERNETMDDVGACALLHVHRVRRAARTAAA
jgi:hypothetical protein